MVPAALNVERPCGMRAMSELEAVCDANSMRRGWDAADDEGRSVDGWNLCGLLERLRRLQALCVDGCAMRD